METTASLIAISQLCGKLIKYVNAVHGAREERIRLRDQIRACSVLLLQLQDRTEDSEADKAWQESIQALAQPHEPLDRLHKALSMVAMKLQKPDKTLEKLKWPFKESDVSKLVAAVGEEMSLLSLAMDHNSGRLLQELKARAQENNRQLYELGQSLAVIVKDGQSQLQGLTATISAMHTSQADMRIENDRRKDREDAKTSLDDRERICKWLSRIDHASQQHSMISERQAGTGSWFLQSDAYRTWLKKSSQTLFCPGMPGAGKSVLTSIIIADLWNRFRTDDKVVVLFFYSDFRRHEEQSKTSILSSMVRQLVEGRREPSTFMRDFFNASREGLRPPMYEDLVKAFEQEASSYSAVFVLVDALDELQDRVDITDALIKLQAMCRFNMLATSRYIPEIVGMFEGAQTLEIRASDDDVKAYLEAHMHRLPRLVSSDPLLRAEIMRRIGESVAGMFLLAKLHVESLVGKRSIKAVRTTLQRLVTGSDAYDSAYTAAMERIERQIADQAELAKQVLAWIVHAKASITKRELQEALGVEIAEPDIDQENWPDVEDMVSACAGLVTIDENTNLVRLVHYTTQEYFNRTRQRWFPDAECMIAQICTSYLSYAPFGSPHTSGASGLSCYPDYEFYPYAARYWGEHARLAPRTLKAVMDFLRLRTNVEATGNHIYRPYFPVLQKTGWASILSTTSLHLVAYFGLEFAITSVLAESAGPDPRDSNGLTPLMTAALRGHESIVRLLLSQGASVDPTDEGLSALYLAANGGYTDIVKLLLDAGTTVIRKSWQYEPLLCAAQNGHDEVVQLLLQHYGTLPGRNVHSAQALFQAAKGGNYRTVKLLSQMAGTITIANYLRPTPLHAAVNQDSVAIVRLLLERKASVNTIDQLGWTPLHTATKRGSEVFVGLFLAQGAHVGVMNISGETPLHLAARGGHFAIGRALLDHGAEITTKSWYGETALQLASEHGHVKFVEMLLNTCTDTTRRHEMAEVALRASVRGQLRYRKAASTLLAANTRIDDHATGRLTLGFARRNGYHALANVLQESSLEDDNE